jgi:hypothetical protein
VDSGQALWPALLIAGIGLVGMIFSITAWRATSRSPISMRAHPVVFAGLSAAAATSCLVLAASGFRSFGPSGGGEGPVSTACKSWWSEIDSDQDSPLDTGRTSVACQKEARRAVTYVTGEAAISSLVVGLLASAVAAGRRRKFDHDLRDLASPASGPHPPVS